MRVIYIRICVFEKVHATTVTLLSAERRSIKGSRVFHFWRGYLLSATSSYLVISEPVVKDNLLIKNQSQRY